MSWRGTSNEYPQHMFMETQEKYQFFFSLLVEKRILSGAMIFVLKLNKSIWLPVHLS